MEYNRLRLSDEEIAFIRNHYQQVNYDALMYYAEGMSTIRNIDLLISSLEYDISHCDFPEAKNVAEKEEYRMMCEDIREKAIYYRDHNGKNRVKGFNTDLFCKRADDISKVAIGEEIGKDIYKIDQAINYVRSIAERFDSEKKVWNAAVFLGTKLGELMLDEGLLNYGFDWDMPERKKYPIILNAARNRSVDPIRFVYDKLKENQNNPDIFGTCSDFSSKFFEEVQK